MTDETKMVIIVGDHPHVGKIGKFVGVGKVLFDGTQMAKIEFDDGSGCFAKKENLMKMPERNKKR